jgi:uncharacterized delta-60 repeat protein
MQKERRSTRRSAIAAVGLTALAIGVGVAGAAPGNLDTRFSQDGVAELDSGGSEFGQALAVQPDGKVIVAGFTSVGNNAVVYRLTPRGKLDPTFDGDGAKGIDSGDIEELYGAALQPDGKIVVVGRTGLNTSAVLYRLLPNGSLDPTFDGDGALGIDLGGEEIAMDVAVQPDGKLVVVGATSIGENVIVYRLNPNGSLDTTFDGDGIRGIDSGGFEFGHAVALQPDGKIVVVGQTSLNTMAVVYRLNPNGSFDTTFDGDGARGVDSGGFEAGYAVALQENGRIVVAGHTSVGHNGVLYRLMPNGALDPTFDGDGALGLDSGAFEETFALGIQKNGKIVVGGVTSSFNGDIVNGVVYRVNQNGSFDTRFDGDGQIEVTAGGFDRGLAIAMQSDGKILFAGTGSTQGNTNAVVARIKSR